MVKCFVLHCTIAWIVIPFLSIGACYSEGVNYYSGIDNCHLRNNTDSIYPKEAARTPGTTRRKLYAESHRILSTKSRVTDPNYDAPTLEIAEFHSRLQKPIHLSQIGLPQNKLSLHINQSTSFHALSTFRGTNGTDAIINAHATGKQEVWIHHASDKSVTTTDDYLDALHQMNSLSTQRKRYNLFARLDNSPLGDNTSDTGQLAEGHTTVNNYTSVAYEAKKNNSKALQPLGKFTTVSATTKNMALSDNYFIKPFEKNSNPYSEVLANKPLNSYETNYSSNSGVSINKALIGKLTLTNLTDPVIATEDAESFEDYKRLQSSKHIRVKRDFHDSYNADYADPHEEKISYYQDNDIFNLRNILADMYPDPAGGTLRTDSTIELVRTKRFNFKMPIFSRALSPKCDSEKHFADTILQDLSEKGLQTKDKDPNNLPVYLKSFSKHESSLGSPLLNSAELSGSQSPQAKCRTNKAVVHLQQGLSIGLEELKQNFRKESSNLVGSTGNSTVRDLGLNLPTNLLAGETVHNIPRPIARITDNCCVMRRKKRYTPDHARAAITKRKNKHGQGPKPKHRKKHPKKSRKTFKKPANPKSHAGIRSISATAIDRDRDIYAASDIHSKFMNIYETPSRRRAGTHLVNEIQVESHVEKRNSGVTRSEIDINKREVPSNESLKIIKKQSAEKKSEGEIEKKTNFDSSRSRSTVKAKRAIHDRTNPTSLGYAKRGWRVKRHSSAASSRDSKDRDRRSLNHISMYNNDDSRYYNDIYETKQQLQTDNVAPKPNSNPLDELRKERAAESVGQIGELMRKLARRVDELGSYMDKDTCQCKRGRNKEGRDYPSNSSTADYADSNNLTKNAGARGCVKHTNGAFETKLHAPESKQVGDNLMEEKFLGCTTGRKISGRVLKRRQALGKSRNEKSHRKWDRWTDWSSCSVTCGKGRQIRWRHCIHDCALAETEMEEKSCQLPACSPGKFLGIF